MKSNFLKTTFLVIVFTFCFAQSTMAGPFNLSMSITDKNAETLAGGFHNKVTPGSKRNYTVTVKNNNKTEAATFYLYPTDVIPKLNGGKDFKYYGEKLTGPGKWISFQPKKVTLKPNESQNFSFDVTFPKTMKYGQYISYFAIQEYKEGQGRLAKDGKTSYQTDSRIKYGIQVIADYKPELAKSSLSFTRIKSEYLSNGMLGVSSFVLNEGTILAKPDISMEIINDKTGQSIFKNSIEMDSVYGGTEAESAFILKENFLPEGKYKVVLRGKWKEQNFSKVFFLSVNRSDAEKSQKALAKNKVIQVVEKENDWAIVIIGILAVIIILLFILIFLKRSKKRTSEGGEIHEKVNAETN